jgi:hypothetical protein
MTLQPADSLRTEADAFRYLERLRWGDRKSYPSFPTPDIERTARRAGARACERRPVSTTNADLGVESACLEPAPRFGRMFSQRRQRRASAALLQPLTSAGASSLVKFHGRDARRTPEVLRAVKNRWHSFALPCDPTTTALAGGGDTARTRLD